MRLRLAASAVASVALLLTGCSDSGDGDGSRERAGEERSEEPTQPPCEAFEGEVVPEDFEGCMSSADRVEAAITFECDDGRKLVAAGPVMGFVGEEAVFLEGQHAADSPEFDELFADCPLFSQST